MRVHSFSKIALALAGLLIVSSSVRAEIPDDQFAKAFEKYSQSEKGKEVVGKAAQSYFEALRDKARKDQEAQQQNEMENQFKNPVKIDIGSSPVHGNAAAKVTIIEFSDFECPFCSRGKATMDEVMKAYPNDVKVVFKNLPLPFHKNATPAAKAAWAAGKQGKFWEFHDELFANQRGLGDEFYTATATKLGLNLDKWKADMASEEATKSIEADKALAEANGISGTPGFFVNGVAVKGAYPFDHFKSIVDRWLAGGAAAPTAQANAANAHKNS